MKNLKVIVVLISVVFLSWAEISSAQERYDVWLHYKNSPSPYETVIPLSKGGYFALTVNEQERVDALQELWRFYESQNVYELNKNVAKIINEKTKNWEAIYTCKIAPLITVEYVLNKNNRRTTPPTDIEPEEAIYEIESLDEVLKVIPSGEINLRTYIDTARYSDGLFIYNGLAIPNGGYGRGIKVGLWEPGYPNFEHPNLSFNHPIGLSINENNCDNTYRLLDAPCGDGRPRLPENYENNDNFQHATLVTGVLLSDNVLYKGAAKDVTFYAGNYGPASYIDQIAPPIDWLQTDKNVDIVLSSAGTTDDVYPGRTQIDYLVDYVSRVYGITFIMAAGNGNMRYVVNKCANCIVVGQYADQDTPWDKEDDVWQVHDIKNPEDWDLEKPDVVACGNKINTTTWTGGWDTFDGTSLSTPMVAALAADILERSKKVNLKGKQEFTRAFIKLGAKQRLKDGEGNSILGLQNEKTGAGAISGYNTFANQMFTERVLNLFNNLYHYYGGVNHESDFEEVFSNRYRYNKWPEINWLVFKRAGNALWVAPGRKAKTILTWNYFTEPKLYQSGYEISNLNANFNLCYSADKEGNEILTCSEYVQNNTELIEWENNSSQYKTIYIQLFRQGSSGDYPSETVSILTDRNALQGMIW